MTDYATWEVMNLIFGLVADPLSFLFRAHIFTTPLETQEKYPLRL